MADLSDDRRAAFEAQCAALIKAEETLNIGNDFLINKGEPESALESYKEAQFELGGESQYEAPLRGKYLGLAVRIWNNIGVTQYKLGQMAEARQSCDEVLNLNANDAKALLTLARVCVDDGSLDALDQAATHCKQALNFGEPTQAQKEHLEALIETGDKKRRKKQMEIAAAKGMLMGVRPVRSQSTTTNPDSPEADEDRASSSAVVAASSSAPVGHFAKDVVEKPVGDDMHDDDTTSSSSVVEKKKKKKKDKERSLRLEQEALVVGAVEATAPLVVREDVNASEGAVPLGAASQGAASLSASSLPPMMPDDGSFRKKKKKKRPPTPTSRDRPGGPVNTMSTEDTTTPLLQDDEASLPADSYSLAVVPVESPRRRKAAEQAGREQDSRIEHLAKEALRKPAAAESTPEKCPDRHLIFAVYAAAVLAVLCIHSLGPSADASYGVDTALLNLQLGPAAGLNLCVVADQCFNCSWRVLSEMPHDVASNVTISSRWTYSMVVQRGDCPGDAPNKNSTSDMLKYHFEEHAEYSLTVLNSSDSTSSTMGIEIMELRSGISTNQPLLLTTSVLVGLAVGYLVLSQSRAYVLMQRAIRKREEDLDCHSSAMVSSSHYPSLKHRVGCFPRHCFDEENPALFANVIEREDDLAAVNEVDPSATVTRNAGVVAQKLVHGSAAKHRLYSLDTFRGICLAIMLFANDGGGGYWFLDHSAWNGLTVADLVFPWFCWIMGTSMVFAFRSRRFRDLPLKGRLLRVSQRAALLFAIGLIDNLPLGSDGNMPADALSHWRIFGVLQYLAVAYWATALITLLVPTCGEWTHEELDAQERHPADDRNEHLTCCSIYFRDLYPYAGEWLVVLCLLITHIGLTKFLPTWDGCPTGYVGPGGRGDQGVMQNCTGGAATYIDYKILGEKHIYDGATCRDPELYECVGRYHDPEGLLGVLNAIVICFLGFHAGRVFAAYQTADGSRRVVMRWLLWAVWLGLVAGALCGFSKDDGWIPINKNLWSASFILALAAGGFVCLSFLHIVVDHNRFGIWSGAPFRYLGMNSILVYVGSQYLSKFPFGFPHAETHAGYTASTTMMVCTWLMIAYYLYANDFFVSL